MFKRTLKLTLMIYAAVSMAISQPLYAQISEFKIMASDGVGFEMFGGSVSISGDYAVVGAGADDDNGSWSGSAYVVKRNDTSWTEEAKLLASDGAADDGFGSVSISGDYAVVGAPGNDDNGGNSGSAYVFKRNGTSWAQEAKLLPSDGAADDWFGGSVSISGDYAVVGANGDDDNGSLSGSAYVFKRTGTSWAQEAKLLPSDGAARDLFGSSVSISGDYAVMGATGDDDNGSLSGSAYVFKRTGTTWAEEAKLLASDGATEDYFGISVSISGDYAVVGASGDNDNGENSGSAYLFKRSGTSWAEEAKLLPSDGVWMDSFGGSVSISDDYAVVGAAGDQYGDDPGSAYLYNGFIPPPEFSPIIAEVTDVPDDQGGWVYLGWLASTLDSIGEITQYGVWELNPEDEWVSLGNVPAIQEDYYIYLAHTFGDSTPEGIFWSTFMVTAHTVDPTVYYASMEDYGYSIDNLSPAVPGGLLAVAGTGDITLSWIPVWDEDFAYYAVYRSTQGGFDPDTMEAYDATIDTAYIDVGVEVGTTYYYRLSAFDFNGNESDYSMEVNAVITGIESEKTGLPAEFSLSQNHPNPFNPETVIEYALPEASEVSLVIFNLRGEEVERLIEGEKPAGYHRLRWDASNAASGVYFYRLQAGSYVETRKMVLLR